MELDEPTALVPESVMVPVLFIDPVPFIIELDMPTVLVPETCPPEPLKVILPETVKALPPIAKVALLPTETLAQVWAAAKVSVPPLTVHAPQVVTDFPEVAVQVLIPLVLVILVGEAIVISAVVPA